MMTMLEVRRGDDRDLSEKQRKQHIASPGWLKSGKIEIQKDWPNLPLVVKNSIFA